MANKLYNGEVVAMTAEDTAELQTAVENAKVFAEQEKIAQAQKDADALAGNNKLLGLGLTQAEVTAMTGYTPPTEV